MKHLLHGFAPLSHLGVIRVEGEDAVKFLQGQLTNDFALLDDGHARLAAFCSPKGRMQASFIGFKRGPAEVLLVCSLDLLATTQKRLSMFVMRAKAKLTDATDQFKLYGLVGDAVAQAIDPAAAPWTRVDAGTSTAVALYPANGQPRALLLTPADAAAPTGAALTTEQWLWTEVQSGVATVSQAIFEALVPQMLNYESVGGVNFKKGCYPGQEVVARSQFRGTLKRRAYVAHADAPMFAGQEVFADTDAEQPCGLVVQAAPAPNGGFDAIVSMQTAAQSAGLTLGAASGASIALLPLPYELLEDI
ncbi:folate-binding protein YgfZ [Rhodoferax koreense]|uniref:Folate-binding protein YgfZ n=1 Tax=Rhodoferax koreensis TaxID=1842727 RepID=A0A1P8JWU4_9BURK|nr:folate-binding protein YgfZ [Rhodoferax koreense]APW38171.1 folate-binding protein YgfZ [Rhodoferax koreense]